MTSTRSQPLSPVLYLEWVGLSCTYDAFWSSDSSDKMPKLQESDDTSKEEKVGPGGFEDVEQDHGYF